MGRSPSEQVVEWSESRCRRLLLLYVLFLYIMYRRVSVQQLPSALRLSGEALSAHLPTNSECDLQSDLLALPQQSHRYCFTWFHRCHGIRHVVGCRNGVAINLRYYVAFPYPSPVSRGSGIHTTHVRACGPRGTTLGIGYTQTERRVLSGALRLGLRSLRQQLFKPLPVETDDHLTIH